MTNSNSSSTPNSTVLRSAIRLAQPSKSLPTTSDKLGKLLRWSGSDIQNGQFKTLLYRFLTDNIPAVSSCIWTWVRLAGAPGKFLITGGDSGSRAVQEATERLERLSNHIGADILGQRHDLSALLTDLLSTLFRDGLFAGFLTVRTDGSGVDRFIPVDPIRLRRKENSDGLFLALETETGEVPLDRPDFYHMAFNRSVADPFGKSMLQTIPFVSYIEQQLVDDMRRTSHNSGFHRLHVQITPPERLAGESDQAYTDRINDYFDSTVGMIRSCEVDDNPVTWDNVVINYIGPDKSRNVSNAWFMNHRAMIEEICAGTNLSPYLLGYSYGATTSWSGFKFDVVMRQVRSIQAELGGFLEWIGNVDLALGGFNLRCRWQFDNSFPYQAKDESSIRSSLVDDLIKLYQAGVIDESEVRAKVGGLV